MIPRRIFGFPGREWQDMFSEMERMSQQVNDLKRATLGRPGLWFTPARVFPAVNITEDKGKYYVRAELPGISPEDIDLQVEGRNLTIAGERKIQSEGENVKYHRREREAGRFSRVISLPGDLDAEKVDAETVNGVLTVAIAKSEASKPKQITVK